MVIVQYPHTVDVTQVTGGGTDNNGYPIPPTTETFTLECRGEPNTRNAIVYLTDGSAYQYSYTIYIKKGQKDVLIDSDLVLHLPDKDVSAKVKMYSQGQLNQRIWI